MHEALISKGQVRGHERQDLINSKFNCALRHHTCPNGKGKHEGGIGGDEMFELFAKHLVKWEGYTGVEHWLISMKELFPIVANEALLRFYAINKESLLKA